MSRTWSRIFRATYAALRLLDPAIRAWYGTFGLGNLVELQVPGRRTGRRRSTLLGLLRASDGLYLGHPNGEVSWTRNLASAGEGELRWRDGPHVFFRPVRLEPGEERDAAILATDQHPFPGSFLYRAGRRHVRAVGVFFRLEPLAHEPGYEPTDEPANEPA